MIQENIDPRKYFDENILMKISIWFDPRWEDQVTRHSGSDHRDQKSSPEAREGRNEEGLTQFINRSTNSGDLAEHQ